jgi:hypothetical protein
MRSNDSRDRAKLEACPEQATARRRDGRVRLRPNGAARVTRALRVSPIYPEQSSSSFSFSILCGLPVGFQLHTSGAHLNFHHGLTPAGRKPSSSSSSRTITILNERSILKIGLIDSTAIETGASNDRRARLRPAAGVSRHSRFPFPQLKNVVRTHLAWDVGSSKSGHPKTRV